MRQDRFADATAWAKRPKKISRQIAVGRRFGQPGNQGARRRMERTFIGLTRRKVTKVPFFHVQSTKVQDQSLSEGAGERGRVDSTVGGKERGRRGASIKPQALHSYHSLSTERPGHRRASLLGLSLGLSALNLEANKPTHHLICFNGLVLEEHGDPLGSRPALFPGTHQTRGAGENNFLSLYDMHQPHFVCCRCFASSTCNPVLVAT